MPTLHSGHKGGQEFTRPDQHSGLTTGAHDDGSIQLLPILAEVLTSVEGTHTMAQKEIGQPGIGLFGKLGQAMDVRKNSAVGILIGKIAVVRLGSDGIAVTQMVMAGDQEPPLIEPLSKVLVPLDILHHAVGNLQDSPGLPLREPSDPMDLPSGGVGRKIEVFGSCHGNTFL